MKFRTEFDYILNRVSTCCFAVAAAAHASSYDSSTFLASARPGNTKESLSEAGHL